MHNFYLLLLNQFNLIAQNTIIPQKNILRQENKLINKNHQDFIHKIINKQKLCPIKILINLLIKINIIKRLYILIFKILIRNSLSPLKLAMYYSITQSH